MEASLDSLAELLARLLASLASERNTSPTCCCCCWVHSRRRWSECTCSWRWLFSRDSFDTWACETRRSNQMTVRRKSGEHRSTKNSLNNRSNLCAKTGNMRAVEENTVERRPNDLSMPLNGRKHNKHLTGKRTRVCVCMCVCVRACPRTNDNLVA